jgi:aspartate kinase
LLGLAAAATGGDAAAVNDGVNALMNRHFEQAALLGVDAETLRPDFEKAATGLRNAFDTIQLRQSAEPAAFDFIAATGELLSSRLVAAAMTSQGLKATWVDARDCVKTDERYSCAAPLAEETNAATQAVIQPIVSRGEVPVLGGFIGSAPDGSTTTLGRGGSDYSASLVGAAIGAEEIQIWSDVDGMLTADPRIVYDAEVVSHLSFSEASELAYFGAKVLHPSTIFPAVSRNIPVRILNSRRPEAKGTLITADPPPGARPFAALACKRGITVIDITSTRMLMAHGFLLRVFEAFERYQDGRGRGDDVRSQRVGHHRR